MNESVRQGVVQEIIEGGAVAVIRLPDPDRLLPAVEAFLKGGLRGIEITLTVPNAFAQIRLVDRTFGTDVSLGVGSVLEADQARRALDAGARFVVSPIFSEEVVEVSHAGNAPVLPGAFTPNEIQRAHLAGADIVKVFPADVVGMPFFRGVLAPMPHLRLMPTGGVTLTNAGEWLKAGAVAVGVGSALVDKRAVAEGDYARLEQNARTLMNSINEAR